MRLLRTIPVAAFCVLFAGCGGGSGGTATIPDGTQASGATVKTLASGSVTAAPRSFCPGIVNIPFSPGQTVTHQHVAGFVYELSGALTLQVGATVTTTGPGQAAFVPEFVIHTETNFGTVPASVDFLRLQLAGKCNVVPLFPGSSIVFAGPDQPGLTPPSYTETLTQVDLASGGRTAQHTGTMQMFLVLSGSVLFVSNGQAMTLGPNQGFFDAANVTGQERDLGGGSRLLVLTVQ